MPGIRSHQAVSTQWQCAVSGRHWSVFSVCVSQEPSLCRAHPHSQGRDRRTSWGSVCSQHDSSHRPLASAWTAHRWRSSSPCPGAPSQCTGQNHPHTQQALKQRQVNTHWDGLNNTIYLTRVFTTLKLHVGHILAINKVFPLAFSFMIHQSLPGAQGGQAEVARVGESVGEVFALNVTSEGGGGPVPELATQPTRVIFVFPRSKVLVQIFIGEKRTLQIKTCQRRVSFYFNKFTYITLQNPNVHHIHKTFICIPDLQNTFSCDYQEHSLYWG